MVDLLKLKKIFEYFKLKIKTSQTLEVAVQTFFMHLLRLFMKYMYEKKRTTFQGFL